jgi:hypothetical protein
VEGQILEWDVFISYAREDSEQIALPLATALRSLGLRVWYDNFALRLGDPLRRSIEEGLGLSRFGVVILSESFFVKEWPQRELDALFARETLGEKIIIPVWHNVGFADVAKHSPLLADKLAVSSNIGADQVAQRIQAVVVETSRYDEERDSEVIPSPKPNEKISSKHLVLEKTSWRAEWFDSKFNQRVYRFDVLLNASAEAIGKVYKVTYYLPPAWGDRSPREIADRQSRFRLKELAWADLFVRAKVDVLEQYEPVDISCHVRLQEAGPRI